MIFSKRIQAIYKMQVFMRADDTGLVFYFSSDDFPGLHRKPYTFTAKAGHKLHGNFYSYHNPIPGRLVVFDHGMGGGHRAYMREIEELARHGISCDGKRAVQLRRDDYDQYDLLVGMDSANIRNMHRMLGGDPAGKIRKLMDYTPRGGDVADPWYSERFDIAYRDIYEGCEALLKELV
jgi:protein-tyrosine-phosphatase